MNKCIFCNSQSITSIHLEKEPTLFECLNCGKRFHKLGISIDSLELKSTTDIINTPVTLY